MPEGIALNHDSETSSTELGIEHIGADQAAQRIIGLLEDRIKNRSNAKSDAEIKDAYHKALETYPALEDGSAQGFSELLTQKMSLLDAETETDDNFGWSGNYTELLSRILYGS